MKRFIRIARCTCGRGVCLGLAAGTAFLRAGIPEDLREVRIHPEIRIRVKTYARESTPIVNPIPWVQFKSMTPEGTRVKKGEPVFEPDLAPTRERLADRQGRLLEVKNEAERRQEELNRSMQELLDHRADLLESKAIQEARLAYLASLPLKENVRIAEGRLEVAESRLSAAAKELDTMRERLKEGLISGVRLEEAQHEYRQQQARTTYARDSLKSARLPASSKSLEVVRLQIQNLDLELSKVDFEIETQKNLHELERASIQRRVREVQEDIEELEEALNHPFLYAPRGGVLLYTPKFKRTLAEGNKAAKEMALAEIPHEESLALEGQLPERVRHLFAEGDPVDVRLNQFPGETLKGTLLSISPFSRDSNEDKNTGVKVLDVVVGLDSPREELAFGLYGWATLSTAAPRVGPAVPITWIRYREGKPHVSVNGVFQEVNGIVHGEVYQFSSPMPESGSIQPDGEWPGDQEDVFELANDRFHASGELAPVTSEGVSVPRMRSWRVNVQELHPENTMVHRGDIVAKLDSEEIRNRAKETRKEVEQATEEKETAEKELMLRKRERDFRVTSAENLLRIRELERDLEIDAVSPSELYQKRLDLTTSELNLQKAKRELARIREHPELTSPTEIARRERQLRRHELEFERSQILYQEIVSGSPEEEKALADLRVIRQATEFAKTKANHFRQVSRGESRVRWRIRRLRRREERMERAARDLKAMEIPAPVSGLVKYEKVWDGVGRSKVKAGMEVYRGMRLLSLSNTGEVYVEVPVPERYVRNLRKDMEVTVRIPAEGNRVWRGRVTQMGQLLEQAARSPRADTPYSDREPTRQQILPVRIRVISDESTQLKPGAVAHVIFPFNA